MDWNQVLNYAAKAADFMKKAVETLAEERDFYLPESVLNTALSGLAAHAKHLHLLSFELHQDWFDVEVIYEHQGLEFGIKASFDVEKITFDHHKQSVSLRERRPITFKPRRFKSLWQQLGFNVWAWWLMQFKKTTPLVHILNNIEGISIKDGSYRFDFSPYIRRKPTFVATLYTLNIKEIRILENAVYLRGSADLKSINLLQELYKLFPPQAIAKAKDNHSTLAATPPLSEAEADRVIDKILAAKMPDKQD